ncbi:hypothetical protein [Spirosoma aerophilum]
MNQAAFLFTVCLSLLTATASFGQVYVDGVVIDTLKTPYCQLICSNPAPLNRASVIIDFGQRFVSTGFNRQKITGPDRQVINFNSTIDALNFMVRQGWELVTFKVLGTKEGSESTFVYMLRWPKRNQVAN